MFSILFDHLGVWNPQLLRELKGRLKHRNVAIAIVLSLVSQLIIFGFGWLALPRDATSGLAVIIRIQRVYIPN